MEKPPSLLVENTRSGSTEVVEESKALGGTSCRVVVSGTSPIAAGKRDGGGRGGGGRGGCSRLGSGRRKSGSGDDVRNSRGDDGSNRGGSSSDSGRRGSIVVVGPGDHHTVDDSSDLSTELALLELGFLDRTNLLVALVEVLVSVGVAALIGVGALATLPKRGSGGGGRGRRGCRGRVVDRKLLDGDRTAEVEGDLFACVSPGVLFENIIPEQRRVNVVQWREYTPPHRAGRWNPSNLALHWSKRRWWSPCL